MYEFEFEYFQYAINQMKLDPAKKCGNNKTKLPILDFPFCYCKHFQHIWKYKYVADSGMQSTPLS